MAYYDKSQLSRLFGEIMLDSKGVQCRHLNGLSSNQCFSKPYFGEPEGIGLKLKNKCLFVKI